jgi:hypothetical protein
MPSIGEVARLLASLLFFYIGVEYGKYSARLQPVERPCAASNSRIESPPRPKVVVQQTLGDLPCPKTSSPSVDKTSVLLSHLYNRNLSTLHLGKATASVDLFPELHHPGSPSKWAFYLSRENWHSSTFLDAPCQHTYLTRTGS